MSGRCRRCTIVLAEKKGRWLEASRVVICGNDACHSGSGDSAPSIHNRKPIILWLTAVSGKKRAATNAKRESAYNVMAQ